MYEHCFWYKKECGVLIKMSIDGITSSFVLFASISYKYASTKRQILQWNSTINVKCMHKKLAIDIYNATQARNFIQICDRLYSNRVWRAILSQPYAWTVKKCTNNLCRIADRDGKETYKSLDTMSFHMPIKMMLVLERLFTDGTDEHGRRRLPVVLYCSIGWSFALRVAMIGAHVLNEVAC